MPSTTPTSGEPEVPPDIPPEYVDAYLAGFRRAHDGELTQVAAEPVDETPEPVAVARVPEAPRGVDERDGRTSVIGRSKCMRPAPTTPFARRGANRTWSGCSSGTGTRPWAWAFDPTEDPDDEPADELRPAPSRPRTGQRAP